ncbi:MAG: hypothetical protein K8R38_08990 [Verrucomicrobia bacterium]|nr:hypothetical protein [Verrucomicrobiota bacterium]
MKKIKPTKREVDLVRKDLLARITAAEFKSKKPEQKAKAKTKGPLKPGQVIVVNVCQGKSLVIYRDGSIIRELDSLARPTGVLTGQGLLGTPKKKSITWTPAFFQFSEANAVQVTMNVSGEPYYAEWLLAGVVIGERTARINRRRDALHAERGRVEDQNIVIATWHKWLQWREEGSTMPFYKHMGIDSYDDDKADSLRKLLKRIGLSTAR